MFTKKQYKICLLILDFLIIALLTTTFLFVSFQSSFSHALRYFTVLSNLFCGLTSYISFITILASDKMPKWVQILEYSSAVCILITFATVLFFLAPSNDFDVVYDGANLLLHLIIPLVVLVKFFLLINVHVLSVRHAFIPSSLMFAYSSFYIINVMVHNGYGTSRYDFYGFGSRGPVVGVIAFVIMVGFGYLLSLLLYFSHLKMHKLIYR